MPTIRWNGRKYKFAYTTWGRAKARSFMRTHQGAKYVKKRKY